MHQPFAQTVRFLKIPKILRLASGLSLLIISSGQNVWAESDISKMLSSLELISEKGDSFRLPDRVRANQKLVLVPFFANCPSTCNLLIPQLDQLIPTLSDSESTIFLALSFDPDESAESLRQFREKFSLDDRWILARTRGLEIKTLLNNLQFQWVQIAPRNFSHPTVFYTFNSDFKLLEAIYGLDFGLSRLKFALGGTRLFSPSQIFVGSLIGLILVTLSIFAIGSFRRTKKNAKA